MYSKFNGKGEHMTKNTGYAFDEYFLKHICTDIKVGVSLNKDKECYFLVCKNKRNEYVPFHKTYTCGFGIAMGDLIGSTEELDFIPDHKEVFSEIENEYTNLKKMICTSTMSKINLIHTVLESCDRFVSYSSGNNDRNTNLLVLPLYAEIINCILKDNSHYDFKKSDKVLKAIKISQEKLSVFASEVMLYDNASSPMKALESVEIAKRTPTYTYDGITALVFLGNEKLSETFITNSFDELVSYLVCKYIPKYHFFCCSNCKRYFAFTTDSKTKNCSRYIEKTNYSNDIGKTCHEVGRLRSLSRTLYSDSVLKIYQRYYKTAFARKAAGKVSETSFSKWSIQARIQRDRCVNGEISSEQLLEWFKQNDLRE